MITTYPSLELLTNERLKQSPDHVEDERLLDHMHLLKTHRHSILNKSQQPLRESWRQSFHLFQRQGTEIHDYNYSTNLTGWLQNSNQMDQIEQSEKLIR